MNDVVAGEGRAAYRSLCPHQRTDTRKHAEHIVTRRWLREVLAGGCEDKLDLLLDGDRLQTCLCDRCVCRANEYMTMPGNCEQDAPVAGVRHHDGAVAGQKLGAENQVDTLTGSGQRLYLRFRQLS